MPLIGGLALMLPPTEALTLVGSALIGVGVGSSVVPALFIVGYSLPNSNLRRVFAIVELLRAVAAFMIAPLMLHFAFTVGHGVSNGTNIALWVCFGISYTPIADHGLIGDLHSAAFPPTARAGAAHGTRSTARSWSLAGTTSARHSCSTTRPTSWTRLSC